MVQVTSDGLERYAFSGYISSTSSQLTMLQDYAPGDLKGKGDTFLLDQALQAHTINENGIEMSDNAFKKAKENGTLDNRDPVTIAGGEAAYADYARANDVDVARNRSDSGGLRAGLKKRIGSLRKKNRADS